MRFGGVIGTRAAESAPVKVESDSFETGDILVSEMMPEQLFRLPELNSVMKRYPDGYPVKNARSGAALGCAGPDVETKEIYTSIGGQFAFRPGRGKRVADDLVTELFRDCSICSLEVRVNGGVEDGDGEFRADIALYDGCPLEGGSMIPGSLVQYSGLEDDIGLSYDLVLDYSDRGICDDGSSCLVSQQDCADLSNCVEDPLRIPPTVWLRLRFDTDDAAVVMGEAPTLGFSADAYDDPQGHCTDWFAGWPTFPHATFYAEILAPADCDTHFLAYLAANPNKPPFFPGDLGPVIGPGGVLRPPVTSPTTRLGDDITLAVDNCILSAYELGMKGTAGAFTMDIDLRWPNITDIRGDTVRVFHGRGDGVDSGAAEVGHFTIDEDVNLSITANDQPIYITWASNRTNTGAMEVNINQAGTSGPFMLAFDVDPLRPYEWVIASDGDNTPAVFYAAIFCRGETPQGACCPDQPDMPGSEMNCFDDVPVTSCVGGRWLADTTCEENLFDPPCGTHACCLAAGWCDNLVREDCLMTCVPWAPPLDCRSDQECPAERTCMIGGGLRSHCTPVCAEWSSGKFCGQANFECPQPCEIGDITAVFFADSLEIDPPGPPILSCAVDARQPHEPNDGKQALGWNRMVMDLACNAATLPWSLDDFQLTNTSFTQDGLSKSLVYDDTRARLSVVFDPIVPGEWTCIEHLDSRQRWCAGSLPGDADQNRLVTVGDISALINAINIPPAFQPPIYATDINRSGLTTALDILRLIDLLNGAGDFEPWITRSLPPCPLEP